MTTADLARKVIIALDVKGREEAYDLAAKLREALVFKIGLELFTAEGPTLFKKFRALRKEIFLDLKLHDIPNTVAGAVASGMRHGVRMMTIHASGGREMMARAAERAREAAASANAPRPILLGVTVLTSLRGPDLAEVGMDADVEAQVRRLAGLAKTAGLDGVVCSPQEIEALRHDFGRDLVIVTPGIRPAWAAQQDQKRTMTPGEALAKGADYLVIGRPVTGAPDPREAFLRVVEELGQSGR
ncbi:MAG: orotidine-5'-phosphate decarboxylase [Candidatus Aminicenantes bacterium]|nr:orotidine-5'-phosphate decarboxylase [Candidatus Aminicenantes bacterium]